MPNAPQVGKTSMGLLHCVDGKVHLMTKDMFNLRHLTKIHRVLNPYLQPRGRLHRERHMIILHRPIDPYNIAQHKFIHIIHMGNNEQTAHRLWRRFETPQIYIEQPQEPMIIVTHPEHKMSKPPTIANLVYDADRQDEVSHLHPGLFGGEAPTAAQNYKFTRNRRLMIYGLKKYIIPRRPIDALDLFEELIYYHESQLSTNHTEDLIIGHDALYVSYYISYFNSAVPPVIEFLRRHGVDAQEMQETITADDVFVALNARAEDCTAIVHKRIGATLAPHEPRNINTVKICIKEVYEPQRDDKDDDYNYYSALMEAFGNEKLLSSDQLKAAGAQATGPGQLGNVDMYT